MPVSDQCGSVDGTMTSRLLSYLAEYRADKRIADGLTLDDADLGADDIRAAADDNKVGAHDSKVGADNSKVSADESSMDAEDSVDDPDEKKPPPSHIVIVSNVSELLEFKTFSMETSTDLLGDVMDAFDEIEDRSCEFACVEF